jgi:hypothetical protein
MQEGKRKTSKRMSISNQPLPVTTEQINEMNRLCDNNWCTQHIYLCHKKEEKKNRAMKGTGGLPIKLIRLMRKPMKPSRYNSTLWINVHYRSCYSYKLLQKGESCDFGNSSSLLWCDCRVLEFILWCWIFIQIHNLQVFLQNNMFLVN